MSRGGVATRRRRGAPPSRGAPGHRPAHAPARAPRLRPSTPPRGGQDSPAGPLASGAPGQSSSSAGGPLPLPPTNHPLPQARDWFPPVCRVPSLPHPPQSAPEARLPGSVCVCGGGGEGGEGGSWRGGGNRSFSGSSQSLMLDTTASVRSPGPNHCRYLMQGQIQKKTRALESILGGPHALHFTEFRRRELEKPDKKSVSKRNH